MQVSEKCDIYQTILCNFSNFSFYDCYKSKALRSKIRKNIIACKIGLKAGN